MYKQRRKTNNEEKKKRKNEKTEVQKKCRMTRKAGKVQQVIEGGGVQVGICERPASCQPSPLRKKNLSNYIYIPGSLW